jgi:hypothetical protein
MSDVPGASLTASTVTADRRMAIVTPSFSRDFELCRELNESVLTFAPEATHYILVDACDLTLFRPLANSRTVVNAIEDFIPKGYFKLPYSKKWWLSVPALVPAKGWLVQQLAKLSAALLIDEPLIVNVDSDVRFVRPVDRSIFVKDGLTRTYRLENGVTAGMPHVKWHRNVSRLLGVQPDELPMDDYVGNVISWKRSVVIAALEHVEKVTGLPWYVAFTRARSASEYTLYGLYVDKVLGAKTAGVWIDGRAWCHTYWGPGPLSRPEADRFARAMRDDDVAFSIAGYTKTAPDVVRDTTLLAVRLAGNPREDRAD